MRLNSFWGQGIRRLRLTGSTDRVGAASSNLRLSLRRAENVKAGLVRRGVPAAALEVAGRGDEQLLVETPDGVAERQNRYVILEIPALDRPPAGPMRQGDSPTESRTPASPYHTDPYQVEGTAQPAVR